MKTYNTFLENLSEYPAAYQIDEASNYAQDKAGEYLRTLDPKATLTVENGEVYIKTKKEIDQEFFGNVQVIFDECFGYKINEMGFTE